jgi:coenzyme Q-binding protein COQ10
MPGIREVRVLPWSAEQMYDLVADVGRYHEFLPWIVAARIRSDSESEMIADLLIGFKSLREKFTSKVLKQRPGRIEVIYLDGPMRDLDNVWTFTALPEGGCEVNFHVEFSFRSAMFERLAGQYFDRAFHRMVGAFEERAAALYGSNSSSAISVA